MDTAGRAEPSRHEGDYLQLSGILAAYSDCLYRILSSLQRKTSADRRCRLTVKRQRQNVALAIPALALQKWI
jgi:hypothetical protein